MWGAAGGLWDVCGGVGCVWEVYMLHALSFPGRGIATPVYTDTAKAAKPGVRKRCGSGTRTSLGDPGWLTPAPEPRNHDLGIPKLAKICFGYPFRFQPFLTFSNLHFFPPFDAFSGEEHITTHWQAGWELNGWVWGVEPLAGASDTLGGGQGSKEKQASDSGRPQDRKDMARCRVVEY